MGRLSEVSGYHKKRVSKLEEIKKKSPEMNNFDYEYKLAILETLNDIAVSLASIEDKMHNR